MRDETFQGICTRCNQKTIHRFDRFGTLRCELCQQPMPSKEAYCQQCGRETLHCEYWNNWTCWACGHIKEKDAGSGQRKHSEGGGEAGPA